MSADQVFLGFDFGMKHIGVAVGQSVTLTATPIETLSAKNGIPNWEQITQLVNHWRPTAFIVGLPLNMDGTQQTITHATRKFASRLKSRAQLPVQLVDERLTTWEAKQHTRKKPNRKETHSIAAKIILEQWLSAHFG